MLISAINVGGRVRKDMGDLRELADSIAKHGLLHPVVVTRDNVLVAGHRRLEAARLLGWRDIAVTVVDVADLLAAERDENAIRKDFTPSEAVAIGRLIEEQHRAKIAAARPAQMRAAGLKSAAARGATTTKTEMDVPPLGGSAEVAAKAVGMSTPQYFYAKKVVAAAEADPEHFGDLPAVMDETGNVSGAHREMERRKGAAERLPINRRTARPNAARELERLALSLEGLALAAADLNVGSLTKEQVEEWAPSITKSTAELRKLLGRMRG